MRDRGLRHRALWALSFAGVAGGLAAWRVDWTVPASRLDRGTAVALPLALAAMVLAGALKAVVWRAAMEGLSPRGRTVRLTDLLSPVFVGYLANTLLPARAGEPIRLYLAHRRMSRRGVQFGAPALVGSALAETLLTTIVGAALVLAASSMIALPPYAPTIAATTMAAAGALILVSLLPAARRRTGRRRPRILGAALSAIAGVAASIPAALHGLRRPRSLAVALTASAAAWLLQWVGVHAVLVGLDVRAGWQTSGAVLVAVTIAQLLPLLPANVGSFQAAVILPLVASYGVLPADALTVAVGLHLVQAASGVLPGLVCLAVEDIRPGSLGRLTAGPESSPVPHECGHAASSLRPASG